MFPPSRFALSLCAAFACSFHAAAEPDADRILAIMSVDGLAHFYLDDPQAEMPTIRQLAAEGVRADRMRPVMPTVTWPNHTTLVTGVKPARHGVIGNSWFDRQEKRPVTVLWDPLLDKDQIVKVPTLYDLAKQAGMKTAAVVWPGTRGAKTLDWTVPCVNSNELFCAYGTPSLWPEFAQAGIPFETEAEGFLPGRGEERDRMHVRMFNHIVRTHRPRLALLHLLEVDHVEHLHGPQSPEAYAAVKFADGCVREVWEELQKSFPGKATLLVLSDHGFQPYQQLIQPYVLLRKEGLVEMQGNKIASAQVRVITQGGSAFLYITDEANRAALTERLPALFRDVEGVDKALTPQDFGRYGMADRARIPDMPDLILTARSGYTLAETMNGNLAVTPKAEKIRGSHGYDSSLEALHASFVAWGAGIQAGAKPGVIDNVDVAPTAAALLGISMPDADGKPLDAILQR